MQNLDSNYSHKGTTSVSFVKIYFTCLKGKEREGEGEGEGAGQIDTLFDDYTIISARASLIGCYLYLLIGTDFCLFLLEYLLEWLS